MHVAVGTGEPLLNVTSQGSSFTGNSVLVGSKDTPHSADRFSTDDRICAVVNAKKQDVVCVFDVVERLLQHN